LPKHMGKSEVLFGTYWETCENLGTLCFGNHPPHQPRKKNLYGTNLVSYHFSLFLNFTPLYISLIYSVFFNKAFEDCSLKKNYIWNNGHALTIEYTFDILYLINTLNKSVTICS
jgi:hypothetical protein